MRIRGCSGLSSLVPALLPALVLACAAGEPGATGQPDLGSGDVLTSRDPLPTPGEPEPVSELQPEPVPEVSPGARACADVHSFAASLAVAVANELHRWDALSDFEVSAGKLALSETGELHCQEGCNNIRAILSLQDAASAAVPEHDPVAFRDQLVSWYTQQERALTQLVEHRLVVDKGVYRLRNRLSGKYMQVDAGSLAENAPVEQRSTASQPGSNEWRLVLDHTTHQLINVRSGKCLALGEDSVAQNVGLVQQTCSGAALQRFGFAKNFDYYVLFSKTGRSLRSRDDSTAEDAPVVQVAPDLSQQGQQWALEPVTTDALSPDVVADGMYTVVAMQSGKSMTVDADDSDSSGVKQDTFFAGDDRHQWYIARTSPNKYNFINRQTGKCLDLESTSTAGRLVQRTCSSADTQRFMLTAAGDGSHVIYSLPGNAVEIVGDTTTQAPLLLGDDSSWTKERRFLLTPVLAGEPHRSSFSHATSEGPCGEYRWYAMQQPGGQPLRAPDEAFVQLMFAGGRHAPRDSDENPYLEQQLDAGRVALAASAPLNGARPAGSCLASDLFFDPTGAAAGGCCVRRDGSDGKLEKASWSAALYLCR